MGNEISQNLRRRFLLLLKQQVMILFRQTTQYLLTLLEIILSLLKTGKLTVTGEIDYIIQETTTVSYILDEQDGDRIVTEVPSGSGAKFVNGETITGATTGATATVLVEDSRNSQLFTTGQQLFETGETVTGSTSGADPLSNNIVETQYKIFNRC